MGGKIDATGQLQLNGDGLYLTTLPVLIAHAAKGKDFIFIGETTHNSASIAMAPITNDSIRALAKAGVKHLCLEVPKEAQHIVDAYERNAISFDEMKKQFGAVSRPWFNAQENQAYSEQFSEMHRVTKESGIHVHFVDTAEPEPIVREQPDMDKLFTELAAIQDPNKKGAYLQERDQKIPGTITKYRHFVETMLAQRYARDEAIAEQMKLMAKDGKVAMIYGASHFSKKRDFNELVGKDRATVIVLEETGGLQVGSGEKTDLPNYVFLTNMRGTGQQAAGKLQSNEKADKACRAAVTAMDGVVGYIGCTVESPELYAATMQAGLPEAMPKATGKESPNRP